MAESKQRQSKPAEEPPAPTKRIVLKRERVLVVPEEASSEQVIAAHKALGGDGSPGELAAWREIGEYEGSNKNDAIQAYAGKPNTPDAKVGVFKAPTVSAWAGGKRYRAPDKPLVQAEDID